MNTFLQLHLLVSYPPSNLNRDDLGRPKTAIFGGSQRLRISSQSLKRAWRTSDVFAPLEAFIGSRTRQLGVKAYEEMREAGISEENAMAWSKLIAAHFAKTRKAEKKGGGEGKPLRELETEQIIHVSPNQRAAISALITQLAEREDGPDKRELDAILNAAPKAADIGMFGRMLADNPKNNVDAAVQVAHAITTHAVDVEDDYFSAVDDLNVDDSGAGHIGEASFAAGLFYLYINIDQGLLLKNLSGDEELAAQTLGALVTACARVAPAGKQNSYAARCYAHYALAERGDQTPRQLSLAFLDGQARQLEESVSTLKGMRDRMDRAYGAWADASCELNVLDGTGSLEELVAFARGGIHG